MPLYDPVVPTRYAAPLLEFVRAQSAECAKELLAQSGVESLRIEGPNRLLTMAQFDRLLCTTARLLGRSDVGFELGMHIGVESHEALSLAIRHCVTPHDMMTMFARYWRLITTCFAVTYTRGTKSAEWIIRPAAGMSQGALHLMEEVFAVSFFTDYVRLVGDRRGVEIYLSISPPPHYARYETLGPSRFHFNASALPEVRCVLSASTLDLPIARQAAGPKPIPPFDLRTIEHGAMPTARCGDWVALMLREADGIQPSRKIFAELLDVSPRTLSRNLESEGIDLRRLSNTIRFERACALLSGSSWSITEIAYRLGYRDAASFTHAFQKLAGRSPRDYRRGEGPAMATSTGEEK